VTETQPVKWCGRCRQTKPLYAFWRKRNNSDGYHNICAACQTPADREWSPREWDGISRVSPTTPPRTAYRKVCLSAGHESGVFWLSDADVKRARVLGLGRCALCGGLVGLEAEIGLQGQNVVREHKATGTGRKETAA
jgi:hypothetical protein